MIMVGFTAYSILRHRLMDINIVLKKGTTYILLLILMFVPSFFLILLSQKIFFNKISYLILGRCCRTPLFSHHLLLQD